jgi:fibro-slime domain-containing protein
MSRFIFIMFASIALSQSVFAQVTVHVLNPWRNDDCAGHRDSLLVEGFNNGGSGNTGWADRSMRPEGGNWFYFTYGSRSNSFTLATYCGPATWQGWVYYKKYTFNIDSLLYKFPTGTKELWITIGDSTQPPQFYDKPLTSKVIYLFNPWPNNSPQISIDNRPPMKMQVRQDICGWYTCFYVGPPDSLYNVVFSDYFQTQKYTSAGLAAGQPLDLRASLTTRDTVYILPKPFPYGAPSLSATFPGRVGECGVRKVSAIFRDWKLDNISFFNDVMGARSGGKGMVQKILVAPDYKPQLTPAAAAANPPNPPVSSWYKTYTFSNGRQNDTCIDLTLKKSDDGKWTFNSDDMGGFFPLDNFNDSNNIKYWSTFPLDSTAVGAKKHNYHFSMEMHLQFVYYKNTGLVFDFCGDDDVWIFVNNRLAVDLGGLNNRVADTFDVDKRNISLGLGLVDGQTYNMDIFYAERNPVGSNLIIQTTMDLRNSAELFYSETVKGPGKTEYLILERTQTKDITCGFTPILNAIDTPTVDFYLEGPQFGQPYSMPTGVYFKGITVDGKNSKVTVDSSSIDGLTPGDYRITFTSTFDKTRSGYLVFTVPPLPPDHLDILNDSIIVNPVKDAALDSLFIPMDKQTTEIFAVLRDKTGGYVSSASAETWISRDTTIVSVAPMPGDKSRCVITKKGSGSAWVVVSQVGLRPDSVKVSAIALYPLITSAIMLDTNADLVPDMLGITISDTFKMNQRLDSIIVAYRGKNYSIPAANAVLKGLSITAPFSPTTGADGRPGGQATIAMTVDTKPQRSSQNFTDGVDPAIIAASVMENEGTGPDTLFVTFSEPILSATLTGKQLLLIKAASGDTIVLNIERTLAQANDSTYTIQATSSGAQPKAGDWLRLVPGGKGGTLSDPSANTPHDRNRAVQLGVRLGPTAILGAYYQDVNADGVIDRVTINFKRPVQPTAFKSITARWDILPSVVFDTASLAGIVKLNDSSYGVPIHGEKAMPGKLSTKASIFVLVDYMDFPDLPPPTALASDSAAPALVSAKLVYGNSLASDSSRFDVLTTVFSENVQPITNIHPFLVKSVKNGVPYQFRLSLLSANNELCSFRVDTIEAGTMPYASKGDSMWIDIAALISDAQGNSQRNPLNRRVALDVVMKEPAWVFRIAPNPFTPAKGFAMEISAGSPTPILDADQYSLNLVIFDMIGNMVVSQALKPKDKGWAMEWNGCNHNGRMVGSGVYSGMIRVFHNKEQISTKRIRIGVKR